MTNDLKLGSCLLILLCLTAPAVAEEAKQGAEEPKQCEHDAMVCVKYLTSQFEGKGWIGIEIDYSEREEPKIRKVIAGSPAEDAGLKPGDVLLTFAGVEYATAAEDDLRQAKEQLRPGREIVLGVRRGEREMDVPIQAGEIPDAVLAQWIGYHLLYAHKEQIAAVETP